MSNISNKIKLKISELQELGVSKNKINVVSKNYTSITNEGRLKKISRELSKMIRQLKEKTFRLKEDLIKYKFDSKTKQRVEQKSKKGLFHAINASRAALKAASAILRSAQLEGKNDKNIRFTLIEYANGVMFKEHVFETSNTLNGPVEKWMGRLNKNGKKVMETRYVKPSLKKISSQRLVEKKRNKENKKQNNKIIDMISKNIEEIDIEEINNKPNVQSNVQVNKLLNNLNKVKKTISKLENNIKKSN